MFANLRFTRIIKITNVCFKQYLYLQRERVFKELILKEKSRKQM